MNQRAAAVAAKKLAKSLGDQWEGKIWESQGHWHYRAEMGDVRIYEHNKSTISDTQGGAYFEARLIPPGGGGTTWGATATTAYDAVRSALQKAQQDMENILAVMESGEKALKAM